MIPPKICLLDDITYSIAAASTLAVDAPTKSVINAAAIFSPAPPQKIEITDVPLDVTRYVLLPYLDKAKDLYIFALSISHINSSLALATWKTLGNKFGLDENLVATHFAEGTINDFFIQELDLLLARETKRMTRFPPITAIVKQIEDSKQTEESAKVRNLDLYEKLYQQADAINYGIFSYAFGPEATINWNLELPELQTKVLKFKQDLAEGKYLNRKYIKLENMGISEVPKELNLLVNLESFECTNSPLTKLPSLSNLRSLKSLTLCNNWLTYLPDLSGLTAIETINCAVNHFKIAPDFSNLATLRDLNLSRNHLTCLTPLTGLPNLQLLSVSENELRELPNLSQLTSLTKLAFDSNQVSVFPEVPNSLRLASFHYNRITQIPAFVGLTALAFSGNWVTQLPVIPTLQILDCKKNLFTSLPSVLDFPNLKQSSIEMLLTLHKELKG